MRNLKKTLAVVLAFAMILSMGLTSMAAYSDVEAGTKVSEAVGILSNLNILTGFEDGTFKPDETVTRAQMAAIICRMLGYEDQAESSKGTTVFNDVAADHWASGYINVAQAQQIINGYGDGNYGPEDKVTYEQAVKMIVSALGYDLAANAKGGYPTGYLAIASAEGITKNANGRVGDAAARGTIAVLVYNSLEVRLMDQDTWTTTGERDEYTKTNSTILSKYLEIDKVEGVVTSVPFVDFAQNYTADADQMITFANNSKRFMYEAGKLVEKSLNQYRYDIALVPEANNMAGKKVVAYVGQEQDDVTGHYMVYAIAEKQGANTVTTISAAQLVELGDKNFAETGMVAYKGTGSNAITSLELENDSLTASINYGRNTATVSTTQELATAAGNGIITLISNDADSKIDVIQIVKYNAEAVLETVENEEGVLTFTFFKGSLDEIDTDNENKLVVVVKDGAVATADALAANDTVSEVVVNRNFRVLYVSSKTVTGTVESYYDDLVTIAGEDYEISALSNYKTAGQIDASLLSGKEGIFFLNVDGQIAADEAVASKGKYGLIVAAGVTSGIGSGYEVEVVLADGTTAVYPLNDNAYIVPEVGANIEGAANVYAELNTNVLTLDGSVYKLGLANLAKAAYEVSIKNGKVTKLVDLAKIDTVSSTKYDAENLEYGAISFDNETVIYSISTESGYVKADHVTIGTAAELLADEEDSYVLNSYDISNQGYAGLVIGTGIAATVPQDGDAVVISSVRVTEIDNSDAWIISGVKGGEEVTYTLYDEDKTFPNANTDIKVGNVILVGTPNAEGRISAYEILYKEAAHGTIQTSTFDNGEYYYAGDVDESQDPTDTRFYLTNSAAAGKDATGSTVSSAPAFVTMRNAANYTLVDYSENSKNPEVLKKSKSASLFGSFGEYNYKVFVRYFDDAQVEVVVYRYAAEVVKNPTFSLSGTTLTISTLTSSATIKYTVNGGAETTGTTVTVAPGDVVRAWAEKTNCISSGTSTFVVPTP
ncbi:MAG: S-layer homology domain-containing protein [Clostridia bacterium]|nr:S-layer homology domain-containing protein [Clostridia bacterium]